MTMIKKILMWSVLLFLLLVSSRATADHAADVFSNDSLAITEGWTLQWSYAFGGNGHAEFAQPFGDIDDDGVNEIILGGYEDAGVCRIYSYDQTQGTYREEYSWFVAGGYYHSPSGACVVDLDEDGDLEFCVSWGYSGADGVYAYSWDGTTLSTLDMYDGTGVTFVYDIYTCDYDDDSHPEVLIANDPDAGGIHVSALGWNSVTSSFVFETSWTCPTGSGYSVPMVWSGDVDNDGKTEVIADVSDLDYATAGTWALNWDNVSKIWTGVPVWTSYPAGTTVFGDGVGDVDGDGTPEIGVGSYGGTPGGWLFEWDGATYTQVWHGDYPGQEPVIESVAVGDADNDGAVEFCFGTGNVHVIGWNGADYCEEATLSGPTNMLAGLNIGDCDTDGTNEIKGCEILGGTGSEFIWKYTDSFPPETTCTLDGENQHTVFLSNVTVTLAALDNGSGVASTLYKLDAGDWTPYTGAFIVTENGTHTLAFYSLDHFGNIEAEKHSTFTRLYALPLSLTIRGGVGVSVLIKNTEPILCTDVPWSIALDGGLQLRANQTSGSLAQILGGSAVWKRLPVLGFGTVTITISVDTMVVTKKGFVLLPFVVGVS